MPIKFSLIIGLATACVAGNGNDAVTPAARWDGWYSEYVLINANEPSQALLTIFPNGILLSNLNEPLKSRLKTDTGRYINVRRDGASYWIVELPVFKPASEKEEVRNDEHSCTASKATYGYKVVCRNLSTGSTLQSWFRDNFGFQWFDYYCGREYRICRYEFRKGSALFGPRMVAILERDAS